MLHTSAVDKKTEMKMSGKVMKVMCVLQVLTLLSYYPYSHTTDKSSLSLSWLQKYLNKTRQVDYMGPLDPLTLLKLWVAPLGLQSISLLILLHVLKARGFSHV